MFNNEYQPKVIDITVIDSFHLKNGDKYELQETQKENGNYYHLIVNGDKCNSPISKQYFLTMKAKYN